LKNLKIIKFILDLLFPRKCLGCNKEGTICCKRCQENIPIAGKRISLKDCPNVDKIIVACEYENKVIKELIHLLKYRGDKLGVTGILGIISAEAIGNLKQDYEVIPVPLHPKRKRMRGFNQSELLAKEIIKHMPNSKLNIHSLKRVRNTKPQVEAKTREARLRNLKNAFKVARNIRNKHVMLVDDVCTTGTTLEECARVLKKAGVKTVCAIVVARNI
jgi:ComF family protein